jgi:hypothetical protein
MQARQPVLRERRGQKAVSLIILGLLLALLALLGFSVYDEVRTLTSFRKVDDYPLYVMHTYFDYRFDEFLEDGNQRASNQATTRALNEMPFHKHVSSHERPFACTCFATRNSSDEVLFGRNFDWVNRPTLLLFTHPPSGYHAVSMVDISYLGLDSGEISWGDRLRLLDAPYLPFDGLNEAGLAVGMMAVPQARVPFDSQRMTLDSLQIVRLLLDHARTVEEAVALLQQYNIDWGGGPPLHYLVADASGASAVIEFVQGEMQVHRNKERWQLATNFVLSGTTPEARKTLCWRYARAEEALRGRSGDILPPEAMAILDTVSQPMTMWSVVYGLTAGEISIVMGRDYESVHEFRLKMEGRDAW